MDSPLLRAEGIISNRDKTKFLVQCDLEETFYRLPGGSIEFGEKASNSFMRDLIEEYDLHISVGELICVNESIVEYSGKKRHDCTLIHWCLVKNEEFDYALIHKELQDVKLIWCTIDQLKIKPPYPEGILDLIVSMKNSISHLVIEKAYD